MKENYFQRKDAQAFTLFDLMAVLAVLALLTVLTIPAFAHARAKSPDAGCLSNLRQMMIGWSMYEQDNNDIMMPNAPWGNPDSLSWCGTKSMDWNNASINTNWGYYTNSIMASYVANDIRIYKCPADVLPSANGQRLRSYSMNGQMGMFYFQHSGGPASYDSGAQIYVKGSDLTCLTPSSAVIFTDESAYTLLSAYGDGYVQISTTTPGFPDAPASWHNRGGGLSFADGHAEIHKWQTTNLTSVPYAIGVSRLNGSWIPCTSTNADWIWFSQHTACKNTGALGP